MICRMTLLLVFVFMFFSSVPFCFSGNELDVRYTETKDESLGDDEEYSHPALVIDNHAYLREQEEKRKAASTTQQTAPVIIINNTVNNTVYNRPEKRRYGRYGYMKDDSFAVGYSSGDTSFYYINGLRPNCCNECTVYYFPDRKPYRSRCKPERPVRPVPYQKDRKIILTK